MSAANPPTISAFDLVINNILQLHPVQMDFVECGRHIGYLPAAAYVARKRGHFPVHTRFQGGRLVCFTHDLIEYMQTGVSQADSSHPALTKKNKNIQIGRPTKMETLAAAARGITVKEMRALSLGSPEVKKNPRGRPLASAQAKKGGV